MKIQFKIIAVILFSLLPAACSAEYRLEVVNYTSEPVTITYKLKEGREFQVPEIFSVENRFAEGTAKPLPESVYTTNMQKRERTLKLEPNQLVLLERGYWNPQAEDGMMGINEIAVEGNKGRISYSGTKFYENFEKKDSSFYTIEYR